MATIYNEFDIELAKDFETEAVELLDRTDEYLMALANGNWSHENMQALFRAAHTLKGVSGMLSLTRVVEFVHKLENLVNLFTMHSETPIPKDESIISTAFTALRNLLTHDVAMIINGTGVTDDSVYDSAHKSLVEIENRIELAGRRKPEDKLKDDVKENKEKAHEKTELDATELLATVLKAEAKSDVELESETNTLSDVVQENLANQNKPNDGSSSAEKAKSPAASAKTVRVDVDILDRLMNIVGELVVAKNKLRHLKNCTTMSPDVLAKELGESSRDLDYFSTEIQRAVMRMRLVPIKTVFNKIPRVTSEISKLLNKMVDIELVGAETEVDKSLVDSLFEPLIHIIRNAVDHGLESTADRKTSGKSERGKIIVRATQDLDRVIVEIEDDGKGINPEKIVQKAIEKNILTQQDADAMKDKEKIELIFHPGFSTAEVLSEVSGRGVGMDVVRTTMINMGGNVTIRSKVGTGTTISHGNPI